MCSSIMLVWWLVPSAGRCSILWSKYMAFNGTYYIPTYIRRWTASIMPLFLFIRTGEGHELQFATNHLGPFLLTKLLLPLLRRAPAARCSCFLCWFIQQHSHDWPFSVATAPLIIFAFCAYNWWPLLYYKFWSLLWFNWLCRVVTVSSMAHKSGTIFFDDLAFNTIAYRPFKVDLVNKSFSLC